MTKKVFAILIAFVFMMFTTTVFAATGEMGNSMNKAGNTVRNVVGGAENVLEDAGSAIGTGMRNLGDTFTAGAARVTNNNNDNYSNNGNNNNNNSNTGNNNSNYTTGNGSTGYTATRTGTDTGVRVLGMSANTWTWFILAITAIAIVGLVWYYATQRQNDNEYTENR